MQWNARKSRNAVAITMIVATLLVLMAEAASAHEGHTHNDGRFDANILLQVGGVAVALTIAYIVTSWVFRYRDSLRQNGDAKEPSPAD